jgi:hypothetical protein
MNGYGMDVMTSPYQLMARRNRFMVPRCVRKTLDTTTTIVIVGITTDDSRMKNV